MKYLKGIFEDNNFKNDDKDILLFFTDYYDKNPNNFIIKNVLVYDNKKVIEKTPYLKEPSKYRKGKLVKVKIDKPDGINFSSSNSLTSLSVLQDLLSDIERFYELSGEEINYKINTDFTGLYIEFLVLGDYMKDSDSKVSKIDKLLKEFKSLFVKRKFRPRLSGNLVELRTKAKASRSRFGDYSISLKYVMNKIKNGDVTLENLE